MFSVCKSNDAEKLFSSLGYVVTLYGVTMQCSWEIKENVASGGFVDYGRIIRVSFAPLPHIKCTNKRSITVHNWSINTI